MSRPDPLKLYILKGITNTLKQTEAGGSYPTDLSDFDPGDGVMQQRVFRGRAWFGDSDPLPMVSLLEGIAPGEDVSEPPSGIAANEYDWPLIVQGFVKDDPVNPTDNAYFILADVRKRLAVEKTRKVQHDPTTKDIFSLGLGSRLTDIYIGAGVVRPADDTSAVSHFWLSLIIRLVDNAANPYG